MRTLLLLTALATTACGDGGGEAASQRVRYERAAAARAGLDKLRAGPGGALALFKDVRLYAGGVVCGTVDGQDGGGVRRFSVAAQGEDVTIEQPGAPATLRKIDETCRGPARRVVSRNAGYTDIVVEDETR